MRTVHLTKAVLYHKLLVTICLKRNNHKKGGKTAISLNNRCIKFDEKSVYCKHLDLCGMRFVKDLVSKEGKMLKWYELIKKYLNIRTGDYLIWRSILAAIPCSWLKLLQDEEFESKEGISEEHIIITTKGISNIKSLSSKYVYDILVEQKSTAPSSLVQLKDTIQNDNINWESYFGAIQKITLDMNSREFLFKILYNYLQTDSLLYKWKLVDSYRCSYCFIELETKEHIFYECFVTK